MLLTDFLLILIILSLFGLIYIHSKKLNLLKKENEDFKAKVSKLENRIFKLENKWY